jgi:hypothetical protein
MTNSTNGQRPGPVDPAEWYDDEQELAAWADRWAPPSQEELDGAVFDPDSGPAAGWAEMGTGTLDDEDGPPVAEALDAAWKWSK